MVLNKTIPSIDQFPQFALAAERNGINLKSAASKGKGKGQGRGKAHGLGQAQKQEQQQQSASEAAKPDDGKQQGQPDTSASDGSKHSASSSAQATKSGQSSAIMAPGRDEPEPSGAGDASNRPDAESAKMAAQEAEAKAAAQEAAAAKAKMEKAFHSLCQGALLTFANPEARFISQIMDFLVEPLAKAHTECVKQLMKGSDSCQELYCKLALGARQTIVWDIQARCCSNHYAGQAGLRVTEHGDVTAGAAPRSAEEDNDKAVKIDKLHWHLCSQVVRGFLPATQSILGLMNRTAWDNQEHEERLVLQALRDHHATWSAAAVRSEPEVQKLVARTDWASGPLERWILLAAMHSPGQSFSSELKDLADDLAQARKTTDLIENAFKQLREREKRNLSFFVFACLTRLCFWMWSQDSVTALD